MSDRDAMQQLLEPIVEAKRQLGIAIQFYPAGKGDAKKFLLLQMPARAANTILNTPADMVVVPDLYPKNHGFDHQTVAELEAGIQKQFRDILARKGCGGDARLLSRFHVFCFKHDLEALILAAETQLASRLQLTHLTPDWTIPVEEQNHDRPPKHVVRDLFRRHGKAYQEAADAPLILSNADYHVLSECCPQCFAPFVSFLEGLTPISL